MATYLGFEPTTENNYYFISYNSEDNERISKVLKGLLDNDVPLWYDYGIEYGSAWESTIAERIDHCHAILLFVTKGIFEKGQKSYVKREWDIAKVFEKDVYVINMDRIPKRKISYDLISWWIEINEKQSISALDYSGEALTNEILKALGITPKASVPKEDFVYVTYAGRDRDVVATLCKALEKNDIKIVTPFMIPYGSDYADTIKQSIEKCSSVVAVISEAGLQSRSLVDEINCSIRVGKPLIPVMIDNCDYRMKALLAIETPINFSGPINTKSEEFKSLVNRIHEYI